jgi:hypothetical protein
MGKSIDISNMYRRLSSPNGVNHQMPVSFPKKRRQGEQTIPEGLLNQIPSSPAAPQRAAGASRAAGVLARGASGSIRGAKPRLHRARPE